MRGRGKKQDISEDTGINTALFFLCITIIHTSVNSSSHIILHMRIAFIPVWYMFR